MIIICREPPVIKCISSENSKQTCLKLIWKAKSHNASIMLFRFVNRHKEIVFLISKLTG